MLIIFYIYILYTFYLTYVAYGRYHGIIWYHSTKILWPYHMTIMHEMIPDTKIIIYKKSKFYFIIFFRTNSGLVGVGLFNYDPISFIVTTTSVVVFFCFIWNAGIRWPSLLKAYGIYYDCKGVLYILYSFLFHENILFYYNTRIGIVIAKFLTALYCCTN